MKIKISKSQWNAIGKKAGWDGMTNSTQVVQERLIEFMNITQKLQKIGKEANGFLIESDEYYSKYPDKLVSDLTRAESIITKIESLNDLLSDNILFAKAGINELKKH